jgi:hypothetical protein
LALFDNGKVVEVARPYHDPGWCQDESGSRRALGLTEAAWLLVSGFVLSPDRYNDDPSCRLVNFVENPVIPSRPNAELILPTGNLVVTSWPRVLLEIQDGSGHPKKILVIQFEQLTFRRASEPDLKHDAS